MKQEHGNRLLQIIIFQENNMTELWDLDHSCKALFTVFDVLIVSYYTDRSNYMKNLTLAYLVFLHALN